MTRNELERYLGRCVTITLLDNTVIEGTLHKTGEKAFENDPNLSVPVNFYFCIDVNNKVVKNTAFRVSHIRRISCCEKLTTNFEKIKSMSINEMASKRLIWKDEFGDTHTSDERINGKFVGDRDVREKLFEYEQEESEGKLIHLPYKIGSEVFVTPDKGKHFHKATLYGCDEKGTYLVFVNDNNLSEDENHIVANPILRCFYDWFIKVYTKSEAEQALKELEQFKDYDEKNFFADYYVSDECKNPDSYGIVCVKCGECGRTFTQDGILKEN